MESIRDYYEYLFKDEKLTHMLSAKVESMERSLKEWTMHVESTRCVYYPLNSFTNKQLCKLRQELYMNPVKLKYEVKLLLNALWPCTPDSVIGKAIHESWQQLFNSPSACMSDPTVVMKPKSANVSERDSVSESADAGKGKALEINELVESEALTKGEKDIYMTMTESRSLGTKPSLTLLVILKSRGEPNCELRNMLVKYEKLHKELRKQNVNITEYCTQEINELLSKQSSGVFLKKKSPVSSAPCKDLSTVTLPQNKPSSRMSSPTGLSATRYFFINFMKWLLPLTLVSRLATNWLLPLINDYKKCSFIVLSVGRFTVADS